MYFKMYRFFLFILNISKENTNQMNENKNKNNL